MTVVAGVDDSPSAVLVLERAAELAKMRGVECHVVFVAHVPIVYVDVPVDTEPLIELQRTMVWSRLEPKMSELDVEMRRVDLDGYPADELVRYAKANDAEVVVVGTRGRGGVASLVLGSTSHRVIHEAGCDVLVVNTPDEE